VYIPVKGKGEIVIDGKIADEANIENGFAHVEVGSGIYSISSNYTKE
jgi:hypothetical protein